MFDMPVIEHCEDPTLKGDGVAHEGFHAVDARAARHSRRGRVDHGRSATSRSPELTGGARPHRAHERAAVAATRSAYGKARGVARDLRGDAAPLRRSPTRRSAAPVPYDTNVQDEPAAARGGRPRRDARRASPTAASTSSPPTTRRITTTRSTSSSTARRSASSGSRRRCRSASIGWCTPGVISLPRLVELLSVNPARILRVPGGTLAEGAPADITILAPDLRRHGRRAARCGRKSKNTPFDGWTLRGGVAATIVGGRTVYREPGRRRRWRDLA